MSTIAEFRIPAEEFALSETLNRVPEMVFKIDRMVADATDHVMPFVWASNGDFDQLTTALESDQSVTNIEVLAELEEERLYRMEWVDTTQIIGYMLVEENATVQRASAHDDYWELRVLFPEREGISATNEYAKNNGFSLDISRIYNVDDAQRIRFDLTNEQREALLLALENGYFEVPREIEQSTLADELNVSHQATSERIRRGTKGVLETVLHGASDDEDDT